jgi:hypothetical protein
MKPLFEAFDDVRLPTWGGPSMPAQVDSWLEERFAWHAIKYLRPEIDLQPQVAVDTSAGRFRVDFLTAGYRLKLAFECDGAAYHQDPDHDVWRDECLLKSGAVSGIYHFPYRDLVEWPEWCFLMVAGRHHDLFRPGALVNLNTLTQGPTPALRMTYRCQS